MQLQPHTATGVDQKENEVVCTEHGFISSEGILRTAPCSSMYKNELPVQMLKMLLQGSLRTQGDPQAWQVYVTYALRGPPLSDPEVSSSANLKYCPKQEADGAASRVPALAKCEQPRGMNWRAASMWNPGPDSGMLCLPPL